MERVAIVHLSAIPHHLWQERRAINPSTAKTGNFVRSVVRNYGITQDIARGTRTSLQISMRELVWVGGGANRGVV